MKTYREDELRLMEKKWLARLHIEPLYKARQLQTICYLSLVLNIVLLLTMILIMGVK